MTEENYGDFSVTGFKNRFETTQRLEYLQTGEGLLVYDTEYFPWSSPDGAYFYFWQPADDYVEYDDSLQRWEANEEHTVWLWSSSSV